MTERKIEKYERIKLAASDGRLLYKRLLLSELPELRERIKKIRKVFLDMQKEYPRLVAISFYGSYVKGYANSRSDIDLCLAIDESHKLTEEEWYVYKKVKVKIAKVLGMSPDKVSLSPYGVGGDDIVENGRAFRLFLPTIGEGIYALREKYITRLESMGPEGEQAWEHLIGFLYDMESNKEATADVRLARKKLYPWTLKEARRYFLRP